MRKTQANHFSPWKVAVLSRFLVLFLTVSLDALFVDYDTSVLLTSPCLRRDESTHRDIHTSETLSPFQNWWGRNLWELALSFIPRGTAATALQSESHHEKENSIMADILENMVVWDSVFMVRIAECGYEYEQFHAFFPLLPRLMRLLSSTIFQPLWPILGLRATLALSGLLISNTSFVASAVLFHRLSLVIVKDSQLSNMATALYCFNPASVFFSAIYSESLFSLLSFAGLCALVEGWPFPLAAALFGLSSATRSNGVLHCGFFLFLAMHDVLRGLRLRNIKVAVTSTLAGLLLAAATVLPLVVFQAFGYSQFCASVEGGDWESGRETLRPWCRHRLPYLYGFVQSYYWQVGFLRYFSLKQIPNFLLAAPILSLVAGAAIACFRQNPGLFLCLGIPLEAVDAPEGWEAVWGRSLAGRAGADRGDRAVRVDRVEGEQAVAGCSSRGGEASTVTASGDQGASGLHARRRQIRGEEKGKGERQAYEIPGQVEGEGVHGAPRGGSKEGWRCSEVKVASKGPRTPEPCTFSSAASLCFVYQACFMAAVAALVMHVQVATRFLAVCPPVYWYAGNLMLPNNAKKEDAHLLWRCLIWGWFLFYVLLGALLFGNFYPFT